MSTNGRLMLINSKNNETFENHDFNDFIFDSKISVPKIVLKHWVLIRKHNFDGKYLYKCDTNSFKITYQWLILELMLHNVDDKDDILQKIKKWFDEILMNYDIKTVRIYYAGSNLTMTREYNYMVNIH